MEHAQVQDARDTVINAIIDSVNHVPKNRWSKEINLFYFRIFAIIQRKGEKPQGPVQDWEQHYIQTLSKQKYSIRDIAFAVPRSLETISRIIKAEPYTRYTDR